MDSAKECTCTELTGSGSEATAASKASFIMSRVSGAKEALGKSFICLPEKMIKRARDTEIELLQRQQTSPNCTVQRINAPKVHFVQRWIVVLCSLAGRMTGAYLIA
jgi:hypothetical protein